MVRRQARWPAVENSPDSRRRLFARSTGGRSISRAGSYFQGSMAHPPPVKRLVG